MSAEQEILARIDQLLELCRGIEITSGPAGAAEVVDNHALQLAVATREHLTAKRGGPLADALRALEESERRVKVLLELLGSTYDRGDPVAVFARAATRDGYRAGLLQARALGAERRAAAAGCQEPALVIEPMATPVTFVRGTARLRSRHRSDVTTSLPFPVVMVPPYPRAAFGALSVIQHEVGHNLDHELQLTEELAPVLAAVARELASDDPWGPWTREVVADAIGTALVGVGLGAELHKWCAVHVGERGGSSGEHPPLRSRVAMCWHWLRMLGVPDACATLQPLAAMATQLPVATQRLHERIATAVLTQPLRGLGGGALRDLAPGLAADHARILHAIQAADRDALAAVPERMLPAVAHGRIAAGAAPTQVAVELLAEATRRPQTAVAARDALFEQRLRSAARSPILDELDGSRKVPPQALFRAATHVVFVGATHDGLPKLFNDFIGTTAARKACVEVFALCPAGVAAMAPRGGQPASRVADLPPLLDQVAEAWAIYEFDAPYYFASYWDADRRGGRIHVSPHGWGMDIKGAPAIDYVWPAGQAAPDHTYEWYQRALAGLRAVARSMSCSSASVTADAATPGSAADAPRP